jgi:hypothetical protein
MFQPLSVFASDKALLSASRYLTLCLVSKMSLNLERGEARNASAQVESKAATYKRADRKTSVSPSCVAYLPSILVPLVGFVFPAIPRLEISSAFARPREHRYQIESRPNGLLPKFHVTKCDRVGFL